jgi:hypothetical protein
VEALELHADLLEEVLGRPVPVRPSQRDYDLHINLPTGEGWVRSVVRCGYAQVTSRDVS